ncbi:substrate-binding domain-containing protein [Streptomyces sp. NPDC058694]|uniref:substrate-binding domain-containing protein n=1 Tax=Streptomyces sp. NPDC058694 TaxID=3346603 RepID=UPI00365E8842
MSNFSYGPGAAAEERLRSLPLRTSGSDHPRRLQRRRRRTLGTRRDTPHRAACPQELAVIGFDDTPHGALFSPAPTTVHIDVDAIDRIAARGALDLPAADVTLELARG